MREQDGFYNKTTIALVVMGLVLTFYLFSSREASQDSNSYLASVQELEKQIQRERSETYRSFEDDERLYNEEIQPHTINEDTDFYMHDHPLPEHRIPREPVK